MGQDERQDEAGQAHTREDHCTHPTQASCDCDWCRWLVTHVKDWAMAHAMGKGPAGRR